MRYVLLIEPIEAGLSVDSPDLAGCVSTGRTAAEVDANLRESGKKRIVERFE